jgi:hypothetical protein
MSSVKMFAASLISCVCILATPPEAYGINNATTTTLSVSQGSITAGTAVTLTALVVPVVSGRPAVTRGQITFCNAAVVHCDGAAVLGVAQVKTDSTASVKLTLGVGIYSVQAQYSGVAGVYSASTSASQAITVMGNANYSSSTDIAASGSVGNYTLTATVTAFGATAATGLVSFLDITEDAAEVSSASLDTTTRATVFQLANNSPLTIANAAQFVVAGDFNNDGIPDLAVLSDAPCCANGSISIFLGNGDGTFMSPTGPYAVGGGPVSMASADLNGDGNLDLIVVNQTDDKIGVLLGDGLGHLGSQTTYNIGASGEFVAVGDFNRDGWPDLAVTDADNTVTVWLNHADGTGTFSGPVTFGSGSLPAGIVTADFNNDGNLDLALVDRNGPAGSYQIGVLLGNGSGMFAGEQDYSLPAGAKGFALTTGDLRNNGTFDLVLANGTVPKVYVLLGDTNNDGRFPNVATYVVNLAPQGISLGDVNGDGFLDLVAANTGAGNGGTVSVLLGNGDGTFQAKTDYEVGSQPTATALADYNGDGLLDIATSDSGSSTSTLLLQARTETATATGVAVYGLGSHFVLAEYAGDASREPSASSTVTLAGSPPIPTTTVVTAVPNPIFLGQSVTLTATITPTPTGADLGTVTFYNNGNRLGTTTVNSSGVATGSTPALPAGADHIDAVYSGNTGFASSTSPSLTVTVNALTTTTTTLAAAPNPAAVGQTVTLTVTVSPIPTGASLGTVDFYNGASLLGSFDVTSSGVVTFAITGLPVGANSLTAVYSGNTAFGTSTSVPLIETVTAIAATSTSLAATPNPSAADQPVTLTATVSPLPTGATLGTVDFLYGATVLATAPLSASGIATFSIATLPGGSDSITAAYSGNAGSAASTSAALTEIVQATYAVTVPAGSVTVNTDGSAAINVTVPSVGGTFDNPVSMSVSGLPAGATASFNPASVTPTTAGALTVLTIQVGAVAAGIAHPLRAIPFASLMLAVGLCSMNFSRKQFLRKFKKAQCKRALLFPMLACVAYTLTGCGSGSLVTRNLPSSSFVLTITGTSGSTHASTTVTIVIP